MSAKKASVDWGGIPDVAGRWRSPRYADCHPEASVVVVTYAPRPEDLRAALRGLGRQSLKRFDVIVVENGSSNFTSDLGADLPLEYVRLDGNYGPSVARNLGAWLARGRIVMFLDDDAIPRDDWVSALTLVHEQHPEVVAVRGLDVPKSEIEPELSAMGREEHVPGSYDLGTEMIPSIIHLEGNCSVLRSELMRVGGWTTPIYAHAGVVLTHGLTEGGKYPERAVYAPSVVIGHDHAKRTARWMQICYVRQRNWVRLRALYPNLDCMVGSYEALSPGQDDAHRSRFRRLANPREAAKMAGNAAHAAAQRVAIAAGEAIESLRQRIQGEEYVAGFPEYDNWFQRWESAVAARAGTNGMTVTKGVGVLDEASPVSLTPISPPQ